MNTLFWRPVISSIPSPQPIILGHLKPALTNEPLSSYAPLDHCCPFPIPFLFPAKDLRLAEFTQLSFCQVLKFEIVSLVLSIFSQDLPLVGGWIFLSVVPPRRWMGCPDPGRVCLAWPCFAKPFSSKPSQLLNSYVKVQFSQKSIVTSVIGSIWIRDTCMIYSVYLHWPHAMDYGDI